MFINPFSLQENFINNESDQMTEFKNSSKVFDPNAFSILHLNITSMKKSCRNLKEFLKNLSVRFSATCLSETWCQSPEVSQNLNYFLSGYNFFYQYRQNCRGGGVCLLVKELLCYKTREDLSINCDAIEALCLEMKNRKT